MYTQTTAPHRYYCIKFSAMDLRRHIAQLQESPCNFEFRGDQS